MSQPEPQTLGHFKMGVSNDISGSTGHGYRFGLFDDSTTKETLETRRIIVFVERRPQKLMKIQLWDVEEWSDVAAPCGRVRLVINEEDCCVSSLRREAIHDCFLLSVVANTF